MIPRRRFRKGNALLLVSGLLVMLTLIAAAYLSRTRAQRTTAAAIHDTAADASRASMIAQQLASDVSQHLFLRPVDPNSTGAGIFGGNSFAARKNPSPYDARYGIEGASTFVGANGRGDMLSDSITPRAPLAWTGTSGNRGDGWPDGYNFAPYSVMPWTNWPDHLKPVDLDAAGANPDQMTNRFFPYLAPLNNTFGIPAASTVASNPIGNPGFGDTRWLRSTEPVRLTQWTLKQGGAPSPVPDGAFFSHWTHLSFPATANNSWRVVPDISDIEGHAMVSGESITGKYAPGGGMIGAGTFVGGALSGDMSSDRDGLGTPYEQWIAQLRPTPIAVKTGAQPTDNDTTFVSDFARRRNLWFQRTGYLSTVGNGTVANMLPNLFKLDDPLGIGRASDPGATPVPASDEFVENSPRNIVSRTFADADGDGWTDSFWFLAPVGQEKNVRTVVGVSIVDNAGMIDVNVATRGNRHTTIGFTPADLALVTAEPEGSYLGQVGSAREPSELSSAPWTDTRVGLFDSPRNFARGRYSAGDPKVSSLNNPSGTNTALYDAVGFEQGFDAYRWAGRPTPMISGTLQDKWSWTSIDSGEPTFLSALGLWYAPGGDTKPRMNYWNGYLHTAPRSANRDPLTFTTPRIDLVYPSVRNALEFGPWQASAPPGTASRWSQSEPLFATYATNPNDLKSWSWQSWMDASFRPSARPPTNAPNFDGAYPGSPFMRPEERTRWFRGAVSGELIAYGPFPFMGLDHVLNGWRDATNDLRLGTSGTRDFLGESIPFRHFDTSDEVELRAYAGLNDPGSMTRLERALNGDSLSRENSTVPDTLLRSSVLAGEAGKAGAQLTSAQWVKDLRRKITTISGQRNELMPPYLWIGRNFIALSRFIDNPYESFQNANLWLDLHPQVPGPVDEDGDGVISVTELQWGSYDLMRVTTSDDPFPDGIKITATTNPVLSPSDWSRGVSLFEYMNRKFDLRQPLLIQRRISQSDLEQIPGANAAAKPYTNEFGLVDEQGYPKLVYAYSVQEQRRAMIDFALNARQRLRPALRTVSPQRQRTSDANPFSATLRDLGPRQAATSVDGNVNVAYAGYTDRFLDQMRMTFDARVAGAVEPAGRVNMSAAQMKGLADLGDLAWRSAWSTEALTASFAANLATWRSRPDLIRDVTARTRGVATDLTPLRPVWQPILPWFESAAAQKTPDGSPYVDGNGTLKVEGLDFSLVKHRPDFGDTPVPTDITRRMREFASPQAIRAVDPSRPSKVANADWGTGMPNADHPAKRDTPTEDSADLVFPGNEKQPFLAECFFGWVYPATTVTKNGVVDLPRSPGRMISVTNGAKDTLVSPAPPSLNPSDLADFTDDEQMHLQRTKFVAVVNGQVGRPRLEPDPSDPRNDPIGNFYPVRSPTDRDADPKLAARNLIPTAMALNYSRGLTRLANASSQPLVKQPVTPGRPTTPAVEMRMVAESERDGFRDELNEIRTPVLVVQVANPWNEPIRLSDFRLNIFGNLYDFPDYELDSDGKVVTDASGEPVPLMLPAATEYQPATATVYLIADSVGVPKNTDWFPSMNAAGTRATFRLENPFTRIRYERVNQADLSCVAMWDPLFRRRWLDYFDLYEYADGKYMGRSAAEVQAMQPDSDIRSEPNPCDASGQLPQRHTVWDKSTSPVTSCMFSQPTWLDDERGAQITMLQAQAEDLRGRLSRSKLLNAMDRSDLNACFGRASVRSSHKHRIDDLWKFKYSLTPDAMRSGVVLERILRDPSGRNTDWRSETMVGATSDFDATGRTFQTASAAPIENTLERYRLRFWPLGGSVTGRDATNRIVRSMVCFPRDSREPGMVFPPRNTQVPSGSVNATRDSSLVANIRPVIEPTTLVVDRFDADDDFNHWTTVVNGPVSGDSQRAEAPFEQARVAEVNRPQTGLKPGTSLYGYPLPTDPASSTAATEFAIGVTGTPLARPDDQRSRFFESPHLNQDRNLITGGRFWTSCAQITIPPTRHRWPDGRDRRMMDLADGWAALPAGNYGAPAFDSTKYFGNGDGKGDVLNPRRDAYWMQWRHLPSLPVMLGSTMMVNSAPTPVMVQDLLSRLPSRVVYVGANAGDPYPVKLPAGDLLEPWPVSSYVVEYYVGDTDEGTTSGNGAWKTEAQLFPTWEKVPGSAPQRYKLLDPSTSWSVPFDTSTPHGQLDADELRRFCQAYPALDRDANGIPDEMQKVFIGFDEPEGNPASFPPPTALSLISARSTVPDRVLGMQTTMGPYVDQGGGFSFELGANVDPAATPGETDAPMLSPIRGLNDKTGFRGSPEYAPNASGIRGITEDRRPGFSSWARYDVAGIPSGSSSFSPTAAQTPGGLGGLGNEREWVPSPDEINGAQLSQETSVDPSFMLPGIVLRTGNESRDYFTTWTRVARSWARNYNARFVTRPSTDPELPPGSTVPEQGNIQKTWDALIRPGSLLARQKSLQAAAGVLNARNATYPGASVSVQQLAADNLPLWTWERQIVSSSGTNAADASAFESGRAGVATSDTPYDLARKDQDGNVMAAEDNLSANAGVSASDALAPRFVFAQRTEPDRCDKPVDMRQNGTQSTGQTMEYVPMAWRGDARPMRQEVLGYQASRYQQPSSSSGTPGSNSGQGGSGTSGGGVGGSTGSASANVRVWPEEIARSAVPIYRAPLWSSSNAVSNPYFAYFVDPLQGRPSSGGLRGNTAMSRETSWTAANNGEFLTAAGDMFAMEPAGSTKQWDPDVWAPDPPPGTALGGVPTPYESDLLWMHRARTFNWLTSPVVAPLPDLQGLGWRASGTNPVSTLDPSDPLPYDAYPELILRKPTAFNCQTVVDDRLSRNLKDLPFTGTTSAMFGGASGGYQPGYRRFLYAKYADFLVGTDDKPVIDGTTRFVYPAWSRPAPRPGERVMSATRADLTNMSGALKTAIEDPSAGRSAYRARWVKGGSNYFLTGLDLFPPKSGPAMSLYRVLMGDKGGRLVDHTGKQLIIDRATMRPALHNGDVLASSSDPALSPILRMQQALCLDPSGVVVGGPNQWLMQGVWNTLDRNPHGGSLQMLHKDDDFEQLGELADVFMWGPAYRVYSNPETDQTKSGVEWSSYTVNAPATANAKGPFVQFKRDTQNNSRGGWLRPTDLQTTVNYYEQAALNGVAVNRGVNADGPSLLVPPRLVSQCRATFAEIMTGRVPGFPVGEGASVNRLQVDPPNIAFHQPADGATNDANWGKPIQMGGTTGLRTPYAPNLPWGMRVFDAFTLDGSGGVLRYDWRDQYAGRSVDMNASSSPVPGQLTPPTDPLFQRNVRAFEDGSSNFGNSFDPLVQDGPPATAVGLSITRFTAARPAGALMPADVYRDETFRHELGGGGSGPVGAVEARPIPTDGRPRGVVTRASMAQWEHDRSPSLSGGFQDRPVPGLVNVNTAPVEVMRALPHMTQLVYDDSGRGRFAGSLDFSLSNYASAPPFALGTANDLPGGLAGSLPAVSGRSVLNTDAQYQNLSTNGDRGANPATKLADAISIYRDRLNPNVLLANTSAASTDWFVRDTKDPMAPGTAGNRLSPLSGNGVSVPDSFPIYPSYVDRGEGAGVVDLTTSSAIVGTGGGTGVTGAKRDPFWFVYFNRGMSAVPGVSTVGELLGMARTTRTRLNSSGAPSSLPAATGFSAFPDWQYDQSWSVQLAGRDPYRTKREDPSSGQGWQSYFIDPDKQLGSDPLDARLSTDRQGVRTFEFSKADTVNNNTGSLGSDNVPDLTIADAFHVEPDTVAGDSEERNMLFKGISNMVSTRSDVFTAYFRVKTVRQGADGRWNAMDPETLLSEARYVMCIDRSKVNRPTDKPRIVYFTQVKD